MKRPPPPPSLPRPGAWPKAYKRRGFRIASRSTYPAQTLERRLQKPRSVANAIWCMAFLQYDVMQGRRSAPVLDEYGAFCPEGILHKDPGNAVPRRPAGPVAYLCKRSHSH
jgi:hypothetical protein